MKRSKQQFPCLFFSLVFHEKIQLPLSSSNKPAQSPFQILSVPFILVTLAFTAQVGGFEQCKAHANLCSYPSGKHPVKGYVSRKISSPASGSSVDVGWLCDCLTGLSNPNSKFTCNLLSLNVMQMNLCLHTGCFCVCCFVRDLVSGIPGWSPALLCSLGWPWISGPNSSIPWVPELLVHRHSGSVWYWGLKIGLSGC